MMIHSVARSELEPRLRESEGMSGSCSDRAGYAVNLLGWLAIVTDLVRGAVLDPGGN